MDERSESPPASDSKQTRNRRSRAAKAKDQAELRGINSIKLKPIKRTLASLSRSLDGTGQQMEHRDLLSLATVAIESLEEILLSLRRGDYATVRPSIRLIRQAAAAIQGDERDALRQRFS